MPEWDPNTLSKRFLYAAQTAESYVQEVLHKVQKRPAYKVVHDEYLARFYVFNRLHGRTWLESPQSLVRELRWMAGNVPHPAGAFDEQVFARAYRKEVAALIQEFTEGAA